MFCPHCGNQLPEGSRFCSKCGKAVKLDFHQSSSYEAGPAGNMIDHDATVMPKSDHVQSLQCPRCGNKKCQPHYQQTVSASGGGYSCLSGGLGFLLAGPFGLLCGLCGRSTQVNTVNTLKWVCTECGLEFRGHQETYNSLLSLEKLSFGIIILCLVLADLLCIFSATVGLVCLICTILMAIIFGFAVKSCHDAAKKECFVMSADEEAKLLKARYIMVTIVLALCAILVLMFLYEH